MLQDDLFTLMQNSRRRAVLIILKQLGGSACLREIVRRIVELENAGNSDNAKARKSVYISLLQNHLPKLEKAGLIKYVESTGVVHLVHLPKDVDYCLELVEKGDIPWSFFYLILSFIGGITGLLLLNFTLLIFSTCVFISALVHFSQTRKMSSRVNKLLPQIREKLTKLFKSS